MPTPAVAESRSAWKLAVFAFALSAVIRHGTSNNDPNPSRRWNGLNGCGAEGTCTTGEDDPCAIENNKKIATKRTASDKIRNPFVVVRASYCYAKCFPSPCRGKPKVHAHACAFVVVLYHRCPSTGSLHFSHGEWRRRSPWTEHRRTNPPDGTGGDYHDSGSVPLPPPTADATDMNDEQVGFNLADLKKLCNSYIDYTRTYMDQRTSLGRIDEEPSSLDYDFVFQFSSDVVDFSSQYGSDISISYTASNLIGRPSKFPNYGDFPQSYVMVSSLLGWSLLGCALTIRPFFSIDTLAFLVVSCAINIGLLWNTDLSIVFISTNLSLFSIAIKFCLKLIKNVLILLHFVKLKIFYQFLCCC